MHRPPLDPSAEIGEGAVRDADELSRFGWTFAPGDKIMQVENDYDTEVYNGDVSAYCCCSYCSGTDVRRTTIGYATACIALTFLLADEID
jgi:hypothetical protein